MLNKVNKKTKNVMNILFRRDHIVNNKFDHIVLLSMELVLFVSLFKLFSIDSGVKLKLFFI